MHRLLIFLALGTALASAQDETTPPLVPPQPEPGAPGQADVTPELPIGADPSGQVLREDQIFPKLTGDELADLYHKFTGRRVTVSVAASTAEFRFIQRAPMTYGQAAQLLKNAALLEGFVFVPDVNMANHDILVLSTSGANPKGVGVEVIIDPADLPTDDSVVSYVMNLKYIKPEEIVRTFTTIIGQLGPYGSITPVPNAGAVVITEKTSLIRRLIELVDEIDVSASVATRFINVQYADVAELAETLNEILNTQAQGERTAGVQRVGAEGAAPPVPGGVPGVVPGSVGGSGAAAEEVPIQIVPDTRTNRIFAMGRPVDIVFIEGLVREFDVQTDERNYLRRKLQFVPVADFLNVAEPALQRAFSGTEDGAVAGGGGGRSTGANFGGSQQTTGRNNRATTGQTGGQGGFGGTTGGQGGFGAAGNTLADPTINSAPEARLVGRTLLVADNITNSLVVQGPPASVEIIENLLDQIDVKAEQVMISAVFGQLTLDDEFDLGVDFLQAVGDGVNEGGEFGGRTGGALLPLLPLDGSPINPGSFAGPGLGLYGRIGSNFSVFLNALQANRNFKVLSRPTIFTANNQRGSISSGQQIAVPTNTFNTGGVGGATQSTNIEYRDVLLNLEVIPLVNSPEEVTLQIALLNDEIIGSQTIDGNDIPTIGRREVLTTVTVPNGSTIVLGGLITSRSEDSVSGVPILSEIPGIGRLFSRTIESDNREELMIFIQPKIVQDPNALYDVQVDMDQRYEVSDEARAFAEGPPVSPDYETLPPEAGPKGTPPPRPVIIEEPEEPNSRARRMLGRPGNPFRTR